MYMAKKITSDRISKCYGSFSQLGNKQTTTLVLKNKEFSLKIRT